MKKGDKLIAINDLKISGDQKIALIKDKEYEINEMFDTSFTIKSECSDYHNFTIDNVKKYFKLKDEWQPKQGDKVLVSSNGLDWHESEFITYYKDEFVVKTHDSIIGRKHIKPYEEEIKVGDWVKNKHGRFYKFDGLVPNQELTKITNPQLIELLNKEL